MVRLMALQTSFVHPTSIGLILRLIYWIKKQQMYGIYKSTESQVKASGFLFGKHSKT